MFFDDPLPEFGLKLTRIFNFTRPRRLRMRLPLAFSFALTLDLPASRTFEALRRTSLAAEPAPLTTTRPAPGTATVIRALVPLPESRTLCETAKRRGAQGVAEVDALEPRALQGCSSASIIGASEGRPPPSRVSPTENARSKNVLPNCAGAKAIEPAWFISEMPR